MLKDRGIPVTSKVLALGVGVALTGALVLLEVPFEFLVGLLVPVVGLGADVAIDGVEALIMPVVFACMVLPRLHPRAFEVSS